MEITDNRENILKVALNLFSKKGYDSVGIQEIVTKSNITKPTLYHYYGSKQGLLEAVFSKYYIEMMSVIRSNATYQGDLVLTLTSLVNTYFTFSNNNKDFFYLQLSLNFIPSSNAICELVKPYHKSFHDFLVEIFKLAVPQHGNVRGHEEILSMSLTGILNHYALGLLNGEILRTDDFVHKVVKQYMYGIHVL